MPRHIAEPDLGPPPDLSDDPDLAPPQEFEDRQLVGGSEPESQEEETTELSDEERMLFSTLLTVGKRSKPINVMDHTVVVQSLRVADDLRIGLYTKKFEESRAFQRAYQLAVCAAGIRTIDGIPLFQPLSEAISEDEIFDQKVERLKDYYPIVINQIYRAIVELDTEFAALAEKLGKLKG